MRKVFKYSIIIIFVIGVVASLGGLGIYYKDPQKFKDAFIEEFELVKITEENLVSEIDITALYEDVNFLNSEDGKLHIEYPKSIGKYKKFYYSYSYKSGKVEFESKSNFFQFSFNSNKVSRVINIYLPETVKDIDIDMASGKCQLATKKDLNTLYIEISSGSIDISNINVVGDVNIEISSGEVSVTNSLIQKNLHADVKSGSLNIKTLSTSSLDIKLISGTLDMENVNVKGLSNISLSSGLIIGSSFKSETTKILIGSGTSTLKNFESSITEIKVVSGSMELSINESIDNYKGNVNILSGELVIVDDSNKTMIDKDFKWGDGTKSIIGKVISGKLQLNFAS